MTAALVIVAVSGWLVALAALGLLGWHLWRSTLALQSQANAQLILTRINDDINSRVAARVTMINSYGPDAPSAFPPTPPPHPSAKNGRARMPAEQPVASGASTTSILDDAHEIERELTRMQRQDGGYTKREPFIPTEEA